MEVDALIAAHVEPHPAPTKSGRAWYRLKEADGGYPIWSIIGSLAVDVPSAGLPRWTPAGITDDRLDAIAADYHISREAVDAAIAYYGRNKVFIDAWLIVNRDE